MFLMRAAETQSWTPTNRPDSEAANDAVARMQAIVLEMTVRQLEELARMRAIGMTAVRQLERSMLGRLSPAEEAVFARRSRGIINDFVKVARAVRQIIVLERELAGLRPSRRGGIKAMKKPAEAPGLPRMKTLPRVFPRSADDDLQEYYDHRPVGEAVGWIRGTLGIEAPEGDPFGSRAEVQAPEVEVVADSVEVCASESPSPNLSHQGRGTRIGMSGEGDLADDRDPSESASPEPQSHRRRVARAPP